MQQKRLGQNGPNVSALGLGCMGMSMGYGPANNAESVRTIHRAIELGVNLIDTADAYAWGHNEELIGKAIQPYRQQLVLATKLGFAKNEGDGVLNYRLDGSPEYIKKACDASLKRLQVDTIDLYYLHRVDPQTPIEDSIGAMVDLVKAGKIRHIGISEVKPATIRRAAAVHPIAAVQTEYSLLERYPENEILPTCHELGIGFVAYSPLSRGFLSGRVTDISKLAADDFRRILPRFQGNNFLMNQKLINALEDIAASKNCSAAQLALAWLLAQGEHIAAIPGAKTVSHLEDNLGALEVQLSAKDLNLLNSIFKINVVSGEKYPAEFECEA